MRQTTGTKSSRDLKARATKAERALAQALEHAGERFEHSYVIRTPEATSGYYVVDFYLPRRNVFVELDGSIHRNEHRKWRDKLRTEAINRARPGVPMLRFWNTDVLKDPDALVRYLRTYGKHPVI
jgi:very-short-patch-repair endonuclease